MKIINKTLLIFLLMFTICFVSSCDNDVKDNSTTPPINDKESNETKELTADEKNQKTLEEYHVPTNILDLQVKHSKITNSDYEYLYFGYYPNRLITDETLINSLNDIKEVNSLGYIEYLHYQFKKVTVVNNHKYASQEQQNDKVFTFGTGFVPGNTYYFLVEPICWKVLKVTNGNEFLLQTEQIIDARMFNYTKEIVLLNEQKIYPSSYDTSSIRQWLNNDFMNLIFTDSEKEKLIEVNNNNEPVVYYLDSYTAPNNTIDKIFLLSYQETTSVNLGFYGLPVCDNSRYSEATDYAASHGLIRHDNDGFTTSIWMIRNSYEYTREVMSYVGYDGSVGTNFYVDAENVGIRPCIKIIIVD